MGDWLDRVVIRPMRGNAEYRECVALQQVVWGGGFSETVSPAILMAAQKVGGVSSGAYLPGEDADGERLIGFVFGITGSTGGPAGEPAHWSDMLAVHPDYRGRGLGLRLKLHQRDVLLDAGIGTVYWTFDPLEAGNARLNLSRLGATAREYHRDLYGETDSPLHRGIGTDRLVADWAIASDRVRDRLAGETAPPAPQELEGAPVLNPLNARGEPADRPDTEPLAVGEGSEAAGSDGRDRVLVLVPSDIQALKARAPDRARAWRKSVRAALEAGIDAGYEAREMLKRAPGAARPAVDETGWPAAYVLTRGLRR